MAGKWRETTQESYLWQLLVTSLVLVLVLGGLLSLLLLQQRRDHSAAKPGQDFCARAKATTAFLERGYRKQGDSVIHPKSLGTGHPLVPLVISTATISVSCACIEYPTSLRRHG